MTEEKLNELRATHSKWTQSPHVSGGQYADSVTILELLYYVDQLRAEKQALALRRGGLGIGQVYGLANCGICKELDNDYLFVGKTQLCQKCFDEFPGSYFDKLTTCEKQRDALENNLKTCREQLLTYKDSHE